MASHRKLEALAAGFHQFFAGIGDAATGSAEGVGRANNAGIGDDIENCFEFCGGGHDPALGHGLLNLSHECAEAFPVFGLFDGPERRAEDFNIVFFEDAGVFELGCEV